jgi:hypothetical protein
MKKFIEIDFTVHKVLLVIGLLSAILFYFWLFIGPVCYLYVTVSDIVNLSNNRKSAYSKFRWFHLIFGVLYILLFFVVPSKYYEFTRNYIDRDYLMLVFWYILPVCFLLLHYYLTKKEYQNFISKN